MSASQNAISLVDNEDEFGDDSFLNDFDVDAAVASATSPTSGQHTTPPTTTIASTTFSSAKPPPPKRAKVSPEVQSRTTTNDPESSSPLLKECLQKYFGFSDFRPGQEAAIQAVLNGQDVAIFWATGSGKSMTYQLPPLYLNKVAIIVSPLISLMQDQVHKLNSLSFMENTSTTTGSQNAVMSRQSKALATYLGSAQRDPQEEARALRGDYPLIFVTPEKLQTSGFLNQIATKLDLCLIAIDESHCVSDWGHDFRPDYRLAGAAIRKHPQLANVPIMALTATAMPRIQDDIIRTLEMRNVFKCQKSFDRTNLSLRVVLKGSGTPGSGVGILGSAMEPLVKALKTQPKSSTIVYAPTKKEVEEVANYLQQRLASEDIGATAEYYHGDLSASTRQSVHLNFLTGRTTVVVATIAFGMGIDKPDTRRVIHFGPPQTVEEYYQQVGRAGRDGLPAECIMYASSSDFDRYQSDFYIGQLSGEVRAASIRSTKALKAFAMNKETCRRKALLEFFQETPSFGDHCGTCDVCQDRDKYGKDASRDFGPVARLVLKAVLGLSEPSLSTLLKVLGGQVVENFRYSRNTSPQRLSADLESERAALPNKVTKDQLKEFVIALAQKRYITEETKTADVGGYKRSWTVFTITPHGFRAMQNHDPIVLPVPDSLRDSERIAEQRRQRVLNQLQQRGIQLDKLPQKEIEAGDGEVIQAYTKWIRKLDLLESKGDHERVAQLQELLSLLEEWRFEAASKLRLAPATVLAEHIMYCIAYAVQTFPRGMKMDSGTLEQAGARTSEVDSLVQVVNCWLDRYMASSAEASSESKDDQMISFPSGPITGAKWAFAVYKPNTKTGLASWESSYLRFSKGESPPTIAMSPSNGRPLAVSTVIGHIQEAFLQGRKVDLALLASFASPPTKSEWKQLEEAEAEMGMDVTGDPTTAGMEGGKYSMTDLLRPIMGNEFADTPFSDRHDDDKKRFGEWCDRLKWYQLLKRGGIVPEFKATSP